MRNDVKQIAAIRNRVSLKSKGTDLSGTVTTDHPRSRESLLVRRLREVRNSATLFWPFGIAANDKLFRHAQPLFSSSVRKPVRPSARFTERQVTVSTVPCEVPNSHATVTFP